MTFTDMCCRAFGRGTYLCCDRDSSPPFQYIYSVLTTSNTQHVQYKKVLFDPHRNLKSLKHNDWRVAVRPVKPRTFYILKIYIHTSVAI